MRPREELRTVEDFLVVYMYEQVIPIIRDTQYFQILY